ncbi:MAG TPA: carboxymuconolactone decarboxylase family protein [Pseudonocardiaceae bacterium]|nr:carboxymuconolactone decarboxylase family protein [Pseudonocardiaceae bacterium]
MEPEEYIRRYREKRGYVRTFPMIMAYADVEFQSRVGQLADYAYAQQRRLSAREKEITLIAVLAASGAEIEHLDVHMKKAFGMGIDAHDILEALELIVVPAGVDKFERAVRRLNEFAAFCPPELLADGGAE